jgi:hypothetical protein
MPYSEALKRAVYKYRYQNKNEEITLKLKQKNTEYSKKFRLKQSLFNKQVKMLCNISIE